MSTFVVRFVGDPTAAFRGRVRHVGSGEEAVFASAHELLVFMEGMNALSGAAEAEVELEAGEECDPAHEPSSRAGGGAEAPRGTRQRSSARRGRGRRTEDRNRS